MTPRSGALAALVAALVPALVWPGTSSAELPRPSEARSLETESTRSPTRVLEAPQAISVVTADELARARPAVGFDEALDLVPGVFAQGSRNFAQDSRVSIRGYGARADFGVRGIKLYVDGVPSTLPDGQTEIDSLDLSFARRIDVVRSQVSSLYGGGGGGVIAVDTIAPTERPEWTARALFGSHHLSRYVATATGRAGDVGYAFGLAYARASGFRDHARGRQTTFLAKLERELSSGWQVRAALSGVWAPEAQDAGGLTAAEVADDRDQARALNVTRDAGERLDQQKLSITLRKPLGPDDELRLTGYGLRRDFNNKLPINRQVDLERSVLGGSVLYRRRLGPVRWSLGLDVDEQRDRRENYANLSGARGPLQLRQRETVRGVGPWTQAEIALPGSLFLSVGARYDWYEFRVRDRFLSNGDRSDRLRFRQLTPRFGLRWSGSSRLQVYANLASAFRVPTTTELAPADGAGGFQSSLDPETTRGVEVGAKGLVGTRLAWDVALFDLHLRDVAVPFDTGTSTIFRDAGRARRRGAEVALSALLGRGWTARLGYTYADYRYREFLSFDGEHEPNVPLHHGTAELRWESRSGWFFVASLRHFSDIEVDDANSAESAGATISDVRVGRDVEAGGVWIQPFAGVRNWSGAEYDQTLRPNAFGGRHFEPAPELEVYAGIELRFSPE